MAIIYDGLVFGLEWRTVISNDDSSGQELRRMAKEAKATHYAVAQVYDRLKYGFAQIKKPGKACAAAIGVAVLAKDSPMAFLHALEGEQFAFIGVHARMPADGMDFVGSRDTCIAKAKEFVNRHKATCFGDATAREVDDQAASCSLKDVREKGLATGQLVANQRISAGSVYAIVAVATGGIIWLTFAQMDAAAARREAAAKPNPRAIYAKQINDKVLEIEEKHQFPSQVIGDVAHGSGFLPFAETFPFGAGGWRMESLTCDGVGSCNATWKRQPGGTVRTFQMALLIDPVTDTATTYPTIDSLKRQVSFKKLDVSAQDGKLLLMPQGTFAQLVRSWMQERKDVGWNISTGSSTDLVPPPPGLKLGLHESVQTGTYTITGPYKGLADLASLPPSMTIDSLSVVSTDGKSTGSFTFTVMGKFYEK